METTATSAMDDLLATARRVLTGGSLVYGQLPSEVNLVIESGSGSHLRAVDGRDYIDYVLGSGPMLLGHANPEIVAAVQAQLTKGTSYYFVNEPAIRLAERLVKAIPCAEQVRFMGSGTDATFMALRCARAHTGRSKILKLEGGWHGMHDYSLWGTIPREPSDYPHAEPDSAGIPPVLGDQVLVAPFNDADTVVAIMDEYASELAAVIVEPLERVLRPRPGFLQAVREAASRHGIVMIFDEVVTGFRIAWGGAQERYGVVPDLACYGKAMAGGFPLSAVAGRADVMDAFGGTPRPLGEVAWSSGTFNGNPVAATAGLAALDVLGRGGTYERLRAMGSRLRAGIEESGRRHGFPTRALGEDAVFGVRFIEDEDITSWADLLAHDRDLGLRWAVECVKRGILIVPNEKFYVSTAHDDDDVERTLEICDAAFKACAA